MTGNRPQLIIAGGGLSGCLVALALAERRPDITFLLIEQGEVFGGNHIWSFFDGDVADEHRWLVKPLVTKRWRDHDVRFPKRARTIGLGYNSIKSSGLDGQVRSRLQPFQYKLGRSIMEVGTGHVVLEGGERIEAGAVIDATGALAFAGLEVGWQKFVGRTYRLDQPHDCRRPIIMDATVDQYAGYRFVYTLPFSDTELMVEDTYYSASPLLDVPLLRGRTDAYVRRQGWHGAEAVSEESGVLPVLISGEVEKLWPASKAPVARLGLRGGFFHPTTGYSLPDAVRNAALLAGQREFTSASLHGLYRTRAAVLWKERNFYQLLNRMLFKAAEPTRRYRVLEHFYRLPEGLIGRFYAGRLTGFDKLRILSGRPPVPVHKALAAMRATA